MNDDGWRSRPSPHCDDFRVQPRPSLSPFPKNPPNLVPLGHSRATAIPSFSKSNFSEALSCASPMRVRSRPATANGNNRDGGAGRRRGETKVASLQEPESVVLATCGRAPKAAILVLSSDGDALASGRRATLFDPGCRHGGRDGRRWIRWPYSRRVRLGRGALKAAPRRCRLRSASQTAPPALEPSTILPTSEPTSHPSSLGKTAIPQLSVEKANNARRNTRHDTERVAEFATPGNDCRSVRDALCAEIGSVRLAPYLEPNLVVFVLVVESSSLSRLCFHPLSCFHLFSDLSCPRLATFTSSSHC